MTMKAMRERTESLIRFAELTGLDELVPYYNETKETLETLWKYGFTHKFSDEFLRVANGYVINTGDYENVSVTTTLDIRCITATKKGVKALAELIVK